MLNVSTCPLRSCRKSASKLVHWLNLSVSNRSSRKNCALERSHLHSVRRPSRSVSILVNEVSKSRSLSTTAAVARISAVLSFTSLFVDFSIKIMIKLE